MKVYQESIIKTALNLGAIEFGEFTLKSGIKSPYFFNFGKLNTGKSMSILGYAYSTYIMENKIIPDSMFGSAYKGIPIVATVASRLSYGYSIDLPFAYNRKESKDHGEGGDIVGSLEGDVLIVDDVITRGTALDKAMDIIRKLEFDYSKYQVVSPSGISENPKLTPMGVLVAFDRCEVYNEHISVMDSLKNIHEIDIHSLITVYDLLAFVETHHEYGKHYHVLADYVQTHCRKD